MRQKSAGAKALFLLGVAALVFLAAVDPESFSLKLRKWLHIEDLARTGPAAIDVTKDDLPYREMLDQLSITRVRECIEKLASFGSRVPGTPGHKLATEYIKGQFDEIFGAENVVVEPFKVVVPVDEGVSLKVPGTGERHELYGLWPNYVKPNSLPLEGVKGRLVYCRKGAYTDYDGIDVKDKIVVLDFDCETNYIKARKLGAASVIFVPRGKITAREANLKWLDQPADIPRFFAPEPLAGRLLALAKKRAPVTLKASMRWKEVECHNIYARVDGREGTMPNVLDENGEPKKWRDGRLIVAAHYDSISVVPRIAPGAEDACGVAVLLEFARVARKYKTHRPMIFLATDAHYQGLAGAADFMRKHYPGGKSRFKNYIDFALYRTPEKGGRFEPIDFDLWISLQLSSHGDAVASVAGASMIQYDPRTLSSIMSVVGREFENYSAELWKEEIRFFNAIGAKKRPGDEYFGKTPVCDSEMACGFGQWGLALATTNDTQEFADTPVNVPAKMDWAGLGRQLETVVGVLMRASRDEGASKTAGKLPPVTADIYGTVVWYDPNESFFVPAAPVYRPEKGPAKSRAAYEPLVVYRGNPFNKDPGTVRSLIATFARKREVPLGALSPTDKEQFIFTAIRTMAKTGPSPGQVECFAYGFDEAGEIVFALDQGQQGTESYTNAVGSGGVQLVVFPCKAFTILDAVDPRYLVALDEAFVYLPNASVPQRWGLDKPLKGSSRRLVGGYTAPLVAVVYMEPGTRFKFAAGVDLLGPKFLLLGTPEEMLSKPLSAKGIGRREQALARGIGYRIDDGILFNPLYHAARDMWVLDDMWLKFMSKYNVRNERLIRLHDAELLRKGALRNGSFDAKRELLAARKALREHRYSDYAKAVNAALGLEARAYPEVLSSATDTVKGIIFYFALLIPFSFFMERLLFAFADIRKRIAGFTGVFLAVFLLLKFVHPAFSLTRSPYVVLLAFVILALAGIVIVIIVGKFGVELKKMKIESQGMYESDVGRLSATAAAIALGIANLRRRPLRTGMTAVAVTLLTFTVISFTSVKTSMEFFRLPRKAKAPYPGALLRTRDSSALYPVVEEHLAAAFGDGTAELLPRYWIFQRLWRSKFIDVVRPDSGARTYVNAALGTAAKEARFLPVESTLIGKGRWFKEGETDACIVSDVAAKNLGINPDELDRPRPVWVVVRGKRLRVVGVFNSKRMDEIKDLDGESFMPAETDISPTAFSRANILAAEYSYSQDIRPVDRLESQRVLILPAETAKDLGGQLINIALKSRVPEKQFIGVVKRFLSRTGIIMFVSEGTQVVAYSSYGTTNLQGLRNLLVPVLIAALIVLNVMMGAVAERSGEIGIYSSVGLAPTHIGALFLAESCVFATVGAVLGYLLGQSVAKVVMLTPWLKGITLNYSSFSAVNCTIIVMVTVFLSTIYPAKVAADRAVPDVSRRWKLPEPEGDRWAFDFPFTVGGADIVGLYVFLAHFFASYTENSVGDFYAENVALERLDGTDGRTYRISLTAWIAPFDLGISQRVALDAVDTGDHNVFRVEVLINRLSGDSTSWKRMNRGFLDLLRKRFLVWRTVPGALKKQFHEEGLKTLGSAS